MIFSLETAKKVTHFYRGFGKFLGPFSSNLETELLRAELPIKSDEYRMASLFSAIFFGLLFFSLAFAMLYTMGEHTIQSAAFMGALAGSVLFFMVLIVLLRYPRIISGKMGEQIDKDLVYALKDLLLSISSGLSMFTALTLVSKGAYGQVTKDVKVVIDKVNTGIPLDEALEELAISTPSENFQNVLWQIINTTKSGANVEGVFRSLVNNMVSEQKSNINKYSNELNVLTLVYMLAAVAIPTIIITLMIILNAFVLAGISETLFIMFISASFFIQLAIIGLIKSRRPVVHV